MDPPSVDIVIPFHGSSAELDALLERLSSSPIAGATTTTVVDNRAGAVKTGSDLVLPAPALQSSYHARNVGAARGDAEWILFLDADVTAPPDLVDRYFSEEPDEDTAVLAGGVADEEPDPDENRRIVAFAHETERMSQDKTADREDWPYAQTANCAIRRRAFDEVGGFVDDIRSGGDADICFRLAALGWGLESRPDARVIHVGRSTIRQLLNQRARHGAGAAWLDRAHPGSFPPRRVRQWLGLVRWTTRSAGRAAAALARHRSLDEAKLELVGPLDAWAFELGRRARNEVAPQARPR